jgi:predicted branched-subunit amino acid permease
LNRELPTSAPFGRRGHGNLVVAATPLALAIGVFGVVFGAAAQAHMDVALVLAMSLLVFSGSLQFAVVGLIAGGAGPAAIVATAVALNARHLVMGAIVRHRLDVGRGRRALLGWFLIDESFGLAVTSGRKAATVLLVSGTMFFVAWQAGTALGVLGARVVAVEGLATAIFPVLFIGLTALTARDRGSALRALTAAGLVVAGTVVLPQVHPFLPIVAAVAVALPSRPGR